MGEGRKISYLSGSISFKMWFRVTGRCMRIPILAPILCMQYPVDVFFKMEMSEYWRALFITFTNSRKRKSFVSSCKICNSTYRYLSFLKYKLEFLCLSRFHLKITKIQIRYFETSFVPNLSS